VLPRAGSRIFDSSDPAMSHDPVEHSARPGATVTPRGRGANAHWNQRPSVTAVTSVSNTPDGVGVAHGNDCGRVRGGRRPPIVSQTQEYAARRVVAMRVDAFVPSRSTRIALFLPATEAVTAPSTAHTGRRWSAPSCARPSIRPPSHPVLSLGSNRCPPNGTARPREGAPESRLISRYHPESGHRRLLVLLRREGWEVGNERGYRRGAVEGLALRRKRPWRHAKRHD
jgi:hypothetical protein